MNRRQLYRPSNLSISAITVLILCGCIVTFGWVGYAILKNKQITLRSEIADAQKRMEEQRVAITMHQAEIAQKLGVFAVRETLAKQESDLRSQVPVSVIEVYQAPVTSNPTLAVAQRE